MDAVELLLDIGPSMGATDGDGVSNLEHSINIISMFLQRKIFSTSADRVSLFVYGSDDTANELADGSEYQHISLVRDMSPVDWDLCHYVQQKLQTSNTQGNLLDALVVASTHLMNFVSSVNDKKVKKQIDEGRKIIMVFSNLDNTSKVSNLESIIAGFKDNNIEVHFICPRLESSYDGEDMDVDNHPSTSSGASSNNRRDKQSKPKTANQLKCEAIVQKLTSELDGCAYDFREAMAAVSAFDKKKKSSMPWKADLVLGSHLKIPVSAYKMITRESLPSFKQCYSRNQDQQIEKKYDTYLPDGMNTPVDKEDVIKGYRYGTDLVPITDDDMANMKYKCEGKDFSLLGFTKAKNIKRHYYSNKDTMVVVAQNNDPVISTAMSALVKALYETDMVAVVRRVYRAGLTPSLGTLTPFIENGFEALYYIELPYMEDMRELEFPTLPISGESSSKSAPDQEQLDAVDDLITCMEIPSGDDEDPLEPANLMNPTMQRLFQILGAKALDPDAEIPNLSDTIEGMIHNNKYTSQWSDSKESHFQGLFKLEKIAKSKEDDNIYKDSSVGQNATDTTNMATGDTTSNVSTVKSLNEQEVTTVGSVNPVSDFKTLLKSSTHRDKAFTEMVNVINQLITESVGTSYFDKILACIDTLRQEAIEANTTEQLKLVNDFLLSIKSLLTGKGPKELWTRIMNAKVSLIDNDEASNSVITLSEKRSFLQTQSIEETGADSAAVADDDQDMLDMI